MSAKTQRLLPFMMIRILPVALVLLGVIWFVFFMLSERELSAQVDQQLYQQSGYSSQIIETRFGTLETSVVRLAANALLINSLIDMEKREEYLPTFLDSLRLPGPQGAVIAMLDYKGRVIHSNVFLEKGVIDPVYDDVIENGAIVKASQEGLTIGVSILYNGLPEGALIVRYDFLQLQELLTHTTSIGRYAVLDQNGQLVVGVQSFLMSHGFEGMMLDERLLAHQSDLKGTGGLRLINYIEREDALQPVRSQYQFMVMSLLIMFLILVGAVILAVYTVSRPLSKLGLQVAKIQNHDDLRRQIEMFGPREIREIAQSINRANAHLHRENEERQLLEMRLRQGQKLEAMGTLAGGVAHEINTPVQYIGDNLKFLEGTVEGTKGVLLMARDIVNRASQHELSDKHLEEFKEKWETEDLDFVLEEIPDALHQSFQGVQQITHIVGAMKEFSHPVGHEKTIAKLSELIDNALTLSRNEWRHIAKIRVNLHDSDMALKCFGGELRQVFLNLIVNAAHAIELRHDGNLGEIEITSEEGDSFLDVSVRDNGCGIPKAEQDRIFQPFYTTKDIGKGSGQGLSIVHDIVTNKHGGTIIVKSQVGQGTILTLRLPKDTDLKYPADTKSS